MELAIFKFPENGKWTRERVSVASFLDMNKLAADCPVLITVVSPDGGATLSPADEDHLLTRAIGQYIAEANGDTTLLMIAEKLFDMAIAVDG